MVGGIKTALVSEPGTQKGPFRRKLLEAERLSFALRADYVKEISQCDQISGQEKQAVKNIHVQSVCCCANRTLKGMAESPA